MSRLSRLLCVLAAVATISACTYRVRESNVVIARAAAPVDIAALRVQFPDYRIAPTRVTTPDGASLYVVRLLRPDAVATVLYFGGNGYTVAKGAPITLRSFRDAPVNVVLVDHRGYGASTGTATLEALMSDAVFVYDHLLEDPQLQRVPLIVDGHSLGSFMAGHVADQRHLAGLILEASVTSSEAWTSHLRDRQSVWIRLLVRRVVPDEGLAGKGNAGVVTALDEPVLFVVGAEDDVAPLRFSQALFDATPLPEPRKRLLVVPGRNHVNAADSPEFRAALASFVTQVAEERTDGPERAVGGLDSSRTTTP